MVNFSTLRRKRRGANAIEFSLTLPVFLLALSGIFDWSWFAYQRSILKTATMVGCRSAAMVDPGEGDATFSQVVATGQAVMMEQVSELGGGSLCRDGCTTSVEVLGTAPGRSLRCSVNGEYQPLWGMAVGNINLSSTSITLMEWQRWTR